MPLPYHASTPVFEFRAVHLDLKGMPPTFPRLLSWLELFAAFRFNTVLVEWEDAFPWSVDEAFRSETVYSEDEVRQFCEKAAKLGLELIPLVQTLGHMENFLRTPGRACLREDPESAEVMNPLAPGAPEFVRALVDDVLRLMPSVRRFHLGGDEAWGLGTHPQTRAYIEAHSAAELYLHNMEPLIDRLNARQIRPLLWHDMMIGFEDAVLARLAPKCDLVIWGYQGHPDTTDGHFNTRYITRFFEHGFTLWGGAAFKGADGPDRDLPDPEQRYANAIAWMEVAQRYAMVGLITTGWSRYNFNAGQCEMLEVSLDMLLLHGILFHGGTFPQEHIGELPALLDSVGAGTPFREIHAAITDFSFWRGICWNWVRRLQEGIATVELDPRRALRPKDFLSFRNDIQKVEKAAHTVRTVLAGLIPELWVERYLSERIKPLYWEANAIDARAGAILATGTGPGSHSTPSIPAPAFGRTVG